MQGTSQAQWGEKRGNWIDLRVINRRKAVMRVLSLVSKFMNSPVELRLH